jgi:hypothetical protein
MDAIKWVQTGACLAIGYYIRRTGILILFPCVTRRYCFSSIRATRVRWRLPPELPYWVAHLFLAGDLRGYLFSRFKDAVSLPILHVDEGSLNWPRGDGLNFTRI